VFDVGMSRLGNVFVLLCTGSLHNAEHAAALATTQLIVLNSTDNSNSNNKNINNNCTN